jgi:hypothetical protein
MLDFQQHSTVCQQQRESLMKETGKEEAVEILPPYPSNET